MGWHDATIVRVDEPDASGNLGAVDAPVQPTFYAYDTLGNLTTVNQGVQTRSFSYSSLSRLLSAANPESGTINYQYDANGNLTRKTDARGVVTDYVYDALNRVTQRNYSLTGSTPPNYQATPNVSYFYDNLPNAKGKLIKVTNGTGPDRSTTEYTAFDIMGRVTRSKQTTDGVTYGNGTTDSAMTYTYNLSGALIEQQYPSGRVVKNVLDGNGDLETVRAKKNANFGFFDYSKNFTYNASSAVTSMQLGNGRWETTVFNSRLQPTQIALGTVQNGTDKLKLNFDYGTTANNGNVASQKITVARSGQSDLIFDQTYTYDSLNRLKTAEEKTGATTNWKQTFVFDRYGNRRFDQPNTTTIPPGCQEVVCNPQIDAATNKLIGYQFDSNGNTTTDANGQTFTYDGENKQVQVNSTGGIVGQYFYDGDGRRVKKYVPATGETTVFVYDASAKLVAEYSTVATPAQDAKVSYLTNDTLGSPRITTYQNGSVISRRDFMPYGEEIFSSQRTAGLNYTADNVRQKFTGYERDNETDLDFAQARYYANSKGRFSSPDPYGGNLVGPQSLNKYSYVGNNPLVFIDPTGLECADANRNGDNDRCIWVSNGQGLYESLWQSQFKQGNDLFDNGYQTIDPNTVDPFRLNNINNNAANPNNTSNLAALQGQLVVLGENGEFVSYEEGVITVDSSEESERGFSVGFTLGGSAGGGIGYAGGAAELSYSEMIFITNRGIRWHSFFGGGAQANIFGRSFGYPNQEGNVAAFGGYGGLSAGPSFSNATRGDQIAGPFQSVNAGMGPGAVGIQMSPDTWVFTPSITTGRGVGGHGNLTTTTVQLPDYLDPQKLIVNSVPKIPR